MINRTDINTIDAAEILAIPATEPQRLFAGDADAVTWALAMASPLLAR